MLILAIDTCLAACSVAIVNDGQILASCTEPMTRGHQERLAPMTREAMTRAGIAFTDLGRIGVTIGPGSFTGLRVGLAFAKGLALALDIPCVGVGSLQALAASAGAGAGAAHTVFAVIDAGRGNIYLQQFEAGRPVTAPDVLPLGVAAARLAEVCGLGEVVLTGPGARLLDGVASDAVTTVLDIPDPVAVARLAAQAVPVPPRPLYLRPPDAKPKAA